MILFTVSRQLGSFGEEISASLASKLGLTIINRDTILEKYLKPIATPSDYKLLSESTKFYTKKYNDSETYLDYVREKIFETLQNESIVIVGFGSQMLFKDYANSFHIRVIAPSEIREQRIMKRFNVDNAAAINIINTSDRKHKRFVSHVYGSDLTECSLYDIVLNTENLSVDACVSAIVGLYKEKEKEREILESTQNTKIVSNISDAPGFKHPAEIEFARILDMYHIDWKYEPKTFPIEWDAEGNVTLAFSPDFYLPKFDTYLELTTMNQKYVTMKNKKARKLRELYPGINVKIVYKKDFLSLVERFSGQGD